MPLPAAEVAPASHRLPRDDPAQVGLGVDHVHHPGRAVVHDEPQLAPVAALAAADGDHRGRAAGGCGRRCDLGHAREGRPAAHGGPAAAPGQADDRPDRAVPGEGGGIAAADPVGPRAVPDPEVLGGGHGDRRRVVQRGQPDGRIRVAHRAGGRAAVVAVDDLLPAPPLVDGVAERAVLPQSAAVPVAVPGERHVARRGGGGHRAADRGEHREECEGDQEAATGGKDAEQMHRYIIGAPAAGVEPLVTGVTDGSGEDPITCVGRPGRGRRPRSTRPGRCPGRTAPGPADRPPRGRAGGRAAARGAPADRLGVPRPDDDPESCAPGRGRGRRACRRPARGRPAIIASTCTMPNASKELIEGSAKTSSEA